VNKEKAGIIESALLELFPEANCEVESDLLAAARSTLGHNSGIACILGTGSNSCFYDGKIISAHVPPLGYILGDEGSGTYLGRKLLADFLKGIIHEELGKKFEKMFPQDYSEFLNNVYKNENVRMYLAAFVPFLKENIEDEYCRNLVAESFEDFIRRNVSCYTEFNKYQVSFIGSVAFHFQEQLKAVLAKQNLVAGVILKEPLENLIQYHLE
jgi:N-acetylglucosamine kinase-like BadF-type ATPase